MVLLNPVAGLHAYVPEPLALSVVLPLGQMVSSAPALTDGNVLIVTVTESSMLPQELVTVTV